MKHGFTLVELVISITISAIVLLFIMNIIGEVFGEVRISNNKAQGFVEVYEIEHAIKTLRSSYGSGNIIIDSSAESGSDVLLLSAHEHTAFSGGYILGMVDTSSNTLAEDASHGVIRKKVLGIKKIGEDSMIDIINSPEDVYQLTFFEDELFPEVILQNLQIASFNENSILEIDFSVNFGFHEKLIGEPYASIGNQGRENYLFYF